jgi:hypothetical protein
VKCSTGCQSSLLRSQVANSLLRASTGPWTFHFATSLTIFPHSLRFRHRTISKEYARSTNSRNYPAALRQQELNGRMSLPKARPISCSDSPPFQRRHMSVLCSAESLSRLPCAINTTFRKMIHIRWCCTDRLRPPGFSATTIPPQIKLAQKWCWLQWNAATECNNHWLHSRRTINPAARCNPILPFNSKRLPNPAVRRGGMATPVGAIRQ